MMIRRLTYCAQVAGFIVVAAALYLLDEVLR